MRNVFRYSIMKLSFTQISKQFADLKVIDNFSCEFEQGQLVALVGPSGCGKSTLLHLAAGLEKPTEGEVLADGKRVQGPHPERMLMFQENALYPWLTLAQNVALALELQKVDKKQARDRAVEWLAKVNLNSFEDYYPHQVSGGMRQRAALARAFISQPKALLLDEPFGALDAGTRAAMQALFKRVAARYRITSLLVTHDLKEALVMGDRVGTMAAGRLRVYDDRDAFVADPDSGVSDEIAFWTGIAPASAASRT